MYLKCTPEPEYKAITAYYVYRILCKLYCISASSTDLVLPVVLL